MKIALSLLVAIVIGFLPCGARAAQSIPDEMYLSLIDRAKSLPEGYDFMVLRAAYQQSSFYNPVNFSPARDLPFFMDRIAKGDKEAQDQLDAYITSNFALVTLHMELANIYKKTGERDKELFHSWMSRGLMNILLLAEKGTGSTDAYKVLARDEVDLIIMMRGLEETHRREATNGRSVYILVRCNDRKKGYAYDTWFDITRIHDAEKKVKIPEKKKEAPAEETLSEDDMVQ